MSRRNKHEHTKAGGLTLVIIGLCLIVPQFVQSGFNAFAGKGMALGGMICVGLGLLSLGQSLFQTTKLPKKEVMRLAEERNGILTLSEITTALDIEPDVAKRTLQALSKDGIASQRWQEFRQNLWEFPDYIKLPIAETLNLAKSKGGRITLKDLLVQGHSVDIAQQTLDTLSQKGLAQQDPASTSPSLILESQ